MASSHEVIPQSASHVNPVAFHCIATPRELAPAMPQGHTAFFDRMYSLLAEDILLSHGPPAPVPAFASASDHVILPMHEVSTFDQCQEQMMRLGFNPTSKDSWIFLGIFKMEGPDPSVGDIVNRQRVAVQLAQACTTNNHGQEVKEQAEACISRAQEAAKTCLAELKEVLRERKRANRSHFSMRWAEIDLDFCAYMIETCKRGGGGGSQLEISVAY